MRANTKVILGILGGVLGGALLVLLLFAALVGGETMGGMGSMMNGNMMGDGMVGMLFMLLFWGLLIALPSRRGLPPLRRGLQPCRVRDCRLATSAKATPADLSAGEEVLRAGGRLALRPRSASFDRP